jgi:hypothetical protein
MIWLGAGLELLRFEREWGGADTVNDVDWAGAVTGSSNPISVDSAAGAPVVSGCKRSCSSSVGTIAAEMPELDVITEMKESLIR